MGKLHYTMLYGGHVYTRISCSEGMTRQTKQTDINVPHGGCINIRILQHAGTCRSPPFTTPKYGKERRAELLSSHRVRVKAPPERGETSEVHAYMCSEVVFHAFPSLTAEGMQQYCKTKSRRPETLPLPFSPPIPHTSSKNPTSLPPTHPPTHPNRQE